MVGMEDDVLAGAGRCGHHSGRRYRRSLCSFFIHLDDGVLLDEAQAQGGIGHGLEIGSRGEGGRHPHVGKDVVEFLGVLGLELRQPEVHVAGDHPRKESVPVEVLEGRCYLCNRLPGLRKDDQHAEGPVSVRKAHHPENIVVLIHEVPVVLHHRHLLRGTVPDREAFIGSIPFGELFLPLALEIQGVEKICQHVRAHLVQHLGNHPVRLLVAPAVDGFQRACAVEEIQIGHLCQVVFADSALVTVFQRILFVYKDGICNGKFCLLVQRWQLLHHGEAVFVHGVHLTGAVAQHLADFIGGSVLCAVQQHPQQELHAERGDDEVFFLRRVDAVEEIKCESVALPGEFGRFGGKLQGLVRVVPGIVQAGLFARLA